MKIWGKDPIFVLVVKKKSRDQTGWGGVGGRVVGSDWESGSDTTFPGSGCRCLWMMVAARE